MIGETRCNKNATKKNSFCCISLKKYYICGVQNEEYYVEK